MKLKLGWVSTSPGEETNIPPKNTIGMQTAAAIMYTAKVVIQGAF